MNTIYKKIFIGALFLFCISGLFSQNSQSVIQSIKNEVDRNLSGLKIDNLPSPFYIRYSVFDNECLSIVASKGSLISSDSYRRKYGTPFTLVGDYFRNNVNYMTVSGMYNYASSINLDNNPLGIATAIWSDLDKSYKSAAENFEAKSAALKQQKQTEEEAKVPDYEQIAPPNILLDPVKMNMDKAYWTNYAQKASEVFKKYPEITDSQVNIYHRNSMIYYYDTEGGKYAVPSTYYSIQVNLSTRTKDGQDISDDWYVEHVSFESMPDLKTFITECEGYAAFFLKLKNAPMIDESYSGPVLFEEMALSHAIYHYFIQSSALMAKKKPVTAPDMGMYYSRDNSQMKANPLEMMMNKKIISRSLNIVSMSGTETYKGVKLDGYFPIDLEGVSPEKEMFLVEKGVLKGMLNGRTPTTKINHSNGHLRWDFFTQKLRIAPGNIRFYSDDTYSSEELKKKLIAAAKEEDYDYAYIVRRMRWNNILAIYKIYVEDGREELVRGAAFADFNMKSFKRILGASKEEYISNNAAAGDLATLIVPQSILFEELEITKDNNISLKNPYVVPQPGK